MILFSQTYLVQSLPSKISFFLLNLNSHSQTVDLHLRISLKAFKIKPSLIHLFCINPFLLHRKILTTICPLNLYFLTIKYRNYKAFYKSFQITIFLFQYHFILSLKLIIIYYFIFTKNVLFLIC